MSAWSNQMFGLQNLKTTIFYGKFYIDIPLSILNIIPVNVHLFRKSQNSQNRRHYLHRKYRSKTLATLRCLYFLVSLRTHKCFSHFYTPTLALFRKINDRFRKTLFYNVPLDRLGEQTAEPHLFKLPLYQRF